MARIKSAGDVAYNSVADAEKGLVPACAARQPRVTANMVYITIARPLANLSADISWSVERGKTIRTVRPINAGALPTVKPISCRRDGMTSAAATMYETQAP